MSWRTFFLLKLFESQLLESLRRVPTADAAIPRAIADMGRSGQDGRGRYNLNTARFRDFGKNCFVCTFTVKKLIEIVFE